VEGLPKPSGLDTSILIAANLAASLDDGKEEEEEKQTRGLTVILHFVSGFFTPGSDKVRKPTYVPAAHLDSPCRFLPLPKHWKTPLLDCIR
jgi:hypothetical protein